MDHVVFFTEASGDAAFRRVGGLDEAVRLVEELRNSHGVDDATVHSLTAVPLTFRAYYRVEVEASAEPAVQPAPVAQPVVEPFAESVAQPVVEPVVGPVVEPAQEFQADPAAGDELSLGVPVLPAARLDADGEHSLGYFAH